jgi:hypothetical protein
MASKTTKRPRINSKRAKKLFKSLKSITKVAKKLGATYVGTRLNLLRSGAYKA